MVENFTLKITFWGVSPCIFLNDTPMLEFKTKFSDWIKITSACNKNSWNFFCTEDLINILEKARIVLLLEHNIISLQSVILTMLHLLNFFEKKQMPDNKNMYFIAWRWHLGRLRDDNSCQKSEEQLHGRFEVMSWLRGNIFLIWNVLHLKNLHAHFTELSINKVTNPYRDFSQVTQRFEQKNPHASLFSGELKTVYIQIS